MFAVVPAVERRARHRRRSPQAGCPFVGAASTTGVGRQPLGFGFVGAQAALQTKVVSPAWGVQLRSLLGTAQGSQVTVAVDDDALGAARAEQARRSLRAAGSRSRRRSRCPRHRRRCPTSPTAATLATGSPAVVAAAHVAGGHDRRSRSS